MLTLQIIQHVPFEGPANIEKWAGKHNHTCMCTKLYEGDAFPAIDTYDILVVMGGPMGVYSTEEYPWVDNELKYIKLVISHNKPVIGICLGAQFIAKALGASVYKGPEKEIGWMPVRFNADFPEVFTGIFPRNLTTFHWHSDTFDIPKGAFPLASTEVVPNQGFIYNDKVIALQFHLEMNETSIEGMLKYCSNDITKNNYVQSPEEIKTGLKNEADNRIVLNNILTYLSGRLN